ncbi:MAG: glycosyltransferase [Armatimonadetes bacterium]|nr:glycosyltransferase [Armatimonadota bacterium]
MSVARLNTPIDIIVVWYQNDGGFFGRRNERIAESLSRHPLVRRVLHLEPPLHALDIAGSLCRAACGDPLARHRLKDDLTRLRADRPDGRLQRRTQWMPLPQTRFMEGRAANYNRRILKERLRRWAARCEINNPLLWLYPPCPYAELVAETFSGAPVVCDCVDAVPEVAWLSPARRVRFEESYRRLLPRAGAVFAVSAPLAESLKPHRADIRVIPNGVDIPNNLDSLPLLYPRPILGYIGSIDERMDTDLVEELLSARRGTLVLAGPVEKAHRPFWKSLSRRFQNLELTGPVPCRRADSLIATFDAALLPHRINPYTLSMDPLKVYRCLAAGKPVIATPVIRSERFGGLVTIAEKEHYIEAVAMALRDNTPGLAVRRREAMLPFRWDVRLQEMMACLEPAFQPACAQ